MTLDIALRLTAILCAAWLLSRLLPRAAAATRHAVWHGAIVAILVAPLVADLVPTFQVPFAIARSADATSTASLPDTTTSERASRRGPDAPENVEADPARGPWLTIDLAAAAERASSTASVAGPALVGLWFALGWITVAWRVRRAAAAPPEWQREADARRRRMRISRHVRVLIGAHPGSPVAAGIWRPAIVLPPASTTWSAARRQAVLVHELAHVRRHDCRTQLLAHLACAIYWFHPLVWIATARLREERERACDDEVLASGMRASEYATHLVAIAREREAWCQPAAAVAMACPALEARVLDVLSARARTSYGVSRWAITAALAVVSAAALGATTGPSAQPAHTTPASAAYSLLREVQDGAERTALRNELSEAATALRERDDPDARAQAAQTIATFASSARAKTIETLRAALSDPDQDVREKAALALAFIPGREVVPALVDALASSDAHVREKAAIGLMLRRDERAVEPLVAALHDRDAQVREKAAIALGASGDPRAHTALGEALADPDPQVREKAASALALLALVR